ncbi:MAG: hypothetical protein A2Z45_08615 [Chloroflexi bacterium RBG_19FT_COMBO_55_16]|nr:MAG: hypothetical protein A2Z45_08615 [Chloroflexi bacterium RBG_19FT_COMBO_55_16]
MKSVLVISIGMPRAGSGWHYNLIHDLVLANGGKDARRIRKQYHLQRFLTEVNCNISTLNPIRLLPVLTPSLLGNTYAVKTHAGPTETALALIRRGRVIPTYIYRDPRAALLSAHEYGQRGLDRGRPNAFSQLNSLDKAVDYMQLYVSIWEEWMACEGVLVVRYEDLVENYDLETERLVGFLGATAGGKGMQPILEKYRPERGAANQKGTHFSRGQAERFRSVFTAEQLARYTKVFASALERMGYLP